MTYLEMFKVGQVWTRKTDKNFSLKIISINPQLEACEVRVSSRSYHELFAFSVITGLFNPPLDFKLDILLGDEK